MAKDKTVKVDNYKKNTTLVRITKETKERLEGLNIEASINGTINKLIDNYQGK